METSIVVAVTGLIGGILIKIVWDWLSTRGEETRAVTAVCLKNISEDIKSIDKKLETLFERNREIEIETTKNCERISSIEEKVNRYHPPPARAAIAEG